VSKRRVRVGATSPEALAMERDIFKSRVPKLLRGPVANRFLSPIRRGTKDPRRVVHEVFADAQQRLYKLDAALTRLIPASWGEAVEYATYLAECEAMPIEQRHAYKGWRERTRKLPPSNRQVDRLNREGITTQPQSLVDAHDAISEAAKARSIELGRTFSS
jgi:hypothetical protein